MAVLFSEHQLNLLAFLCAGPALSPVMWSYSLALTGIFDFLTITS